MIRRESNPFDNGKQSHMHPFPQGITSNGWKIPPAICLSDGQRAVGLAIRKGQKGLMH